MTVSWIAATISISWFGWSLVMAAWTVPWDSVIKEIKDWQTLITGGFAILGAFLLWIQILDQRKIAQRELERTNISARIRLPHALSELIDYWQACFEAWELKKPDSRPSAPSSALQLVMDAGVSSDTGTFESFRRLVVLAQAFEARLSNRRGFVPINQLDQMIADLATLTFLTNNLFDYGRFECDTVPFVKPSRDDLEKVISRTLDETFRLEVDHVLAGRVQKALDVRFPKPRDTKD
ncbi:hypothetical protein CU102_27725 [Phyllobacterium brassicacearum]|uniref:Uncharacterized protein n=2 Tax=Phyllobacterium brassicacearum TaxID=314235 RepID=A0A2P7AXW5_9HYPH|nr:hypothetical protein CU102_27725 [Phyllobacterium brassicacearum]